METLKEARHEIREQEKALDRIFDKHERKTPTKKTGDKKLLERRQP